MQLEPYIFPTCKIATLSHIIHTQEEKERERLAIKSKINTPLSLIIVSKKKKSPVKRNVKRNEMEINFFLSIYPRPTHAKSKVTNEVIDSRIKIQLYQRWRKKKISRQTHSRDSSGAARFPRTWTLARALRGGGGGGREVASIRECSARTRAARNVRGAHPLRHALAPACISYAAVPRR